MQNTQVINNCMSILLFLCLKNLFIQFQSFFKENLLYLIHNKKRGGMKNEPKIFN